MKYKLILSPEIIAKIHVLPPVLKKQVRGGFEVIEENPYIGKLLKENLKGFWSYKVNRYRIIYHIHRNRIQVEIIGIGPRSTIYEELSDFVQKSSLHK